MLVRRGLSDPEAAEAFLDAREEHPHSAFEGMDAALELIAGHLAAGTRITVHGDYDVDGVCATAILVRALRTLGGDAHAFLPDRLQDGYGLSARTIELLAARGTRLVLTVDCGITAVEQVARARQIGIDVLVTDHHAPCQDGRLPDCPILHPALCGYPCPELCGAAVAFKLAQALGAPSASEELELVALATVADLVPLRGENRHLVRQGLAHLAGTARCGLRALMTHSRVDPSALDAHCLAFRLAPRINASGRLRRADAGLELLLTEDEQRANEIARELDAVNAERRALEQRILWEAENQVAQLGDRPAYVLAGERWHPGVVGIVASRLVERYHRPTILVALGEDGIGQGSGRSIPGFDLLAALHAAAHHMLRYGGHRAAAGLTVSRERLGELGRAIEHYAEAVLTPDLLTPREPVDAIVSGSELGLDLIEELGRLEPCGIGNPRPRLLVPGARFDQVRAMGEEGKHARFWVTSGGARANAAAFGCYSEVASQAGTPVDATFKLERNVWNGTVEPRLILRHTWPCSPEPIEVLGQQANYLQAVLDEFDRPGCDDEGGFSRAGARTVLDRRGESPLAVLADAKAGGGEMLAVCADVGRRLDGLQRRCGGFALTSADALEREPALTRRFAHIVMLDPPTNPLLHAIVRTGTGFTHLAWGEAELRFARQMHELENRLRDSLVVLYRSLRMRRRVAGEELERLLRGEGRHGRPVHLAAKLIKTLAELELVSLDRDLPAVSVVSQKKVELDDSPTYRAHSQRYEDGLRYLKDENLPLSA